MNSKKCSACGESKNLDLFSKSKTSKDERQSKCKVCVSLYFQKNKDILYAKHREWCNKNADSVKRKAAENRKKYKNKEKTPEQYTWYSMNQRCKNKNAPEYGDYGGRGIAICDRWSKFSNFISDMGPRPFGTSIDRIDNSKGYFPENCRWATKAQQQNNIRSNIVIEIEGVKKTLMQWCNELGKKYITVRARINRNWNPIDALMKPIGRYAITKESN